MDKCSSPIPNQEGEKFSLGKCKECFGTEVDGKKFLKCM